MTCAIVARWWSLCGSTKPAATRSVFASTCAQCRVLGDALNEAGFVDDMGHVDMRAFPWAPHFVSLAERERRLSDHYTAAGRMRLAQLMIDAGFVATPEALEMARIIEET